MNARIPSRLVSKTPDGQSGDAGAIPAGGANQPIKLGGKPRTHVGKTCPYCGVTMTRSLKHDTSATRDHIKPKYWGGNNLPSNRVIVCQKCNRDKGDRFITTWAHELRKKNDPRAALVAKFIEELIGRAVRQQGNELTEG